jgi:uncharacterized protein
MKPDLCSYLNKHEDYLRSRQARVDHCKSGLDFAVDAEKVLLGDTVTMIDCGEVRQISAGFLGDRMVVIVWTRRGASHHIISMRYCHGKEEKRWLKILRQTSQQRSR